ncbi:DinB family protein [Deinococcus aerophilus]|uniref:DinB-like domain-containing protein n=1 Tax=Deinococcus aerophilus TaxID=522488 RepID=A0ABQ2GM30_9DEIO|nr:DinB family protein [Deinococcus aerophilus]GGM01937.1 hypothetical protein GCM10010841_07960 [Deinococcus aerophilus]
MVSEIFGKAVGNLYLGGPANVSWQRALENLSAGDAGRVPDPLPHSVAQVVAHVQFWQVHLLETIAGQNPPTPEHASGGWPPPGDLPGDWEALRETFLRNAGKLRAHARDPGLAATPDRQGLPYAALLTSYAGHNVYHLGQVVTIRQALGLWPPLGGGDTW